MRVAKISLIPIEEAGLEEEAIQKFVIRVWRVSIFINVPYIHMVSAEGRDEGFVLLLRFYRK